MTRLNTIDGELLRAQKSASGISPSAQLSLSTSFQQVGPDIDLGNAPGLSAMLKWTYGADTQTLTLRVMVSHDGVVFQWAPSFGAVTVSAPNATSAANILNVTYLGSTWIEPGATAFAYCPLEAQLTGWRFARIYAKASAAAGTIETTSTFCASTGA